jgi:hypothetical protein
MAAAIGLRSDYPSADLRRFAGRCDDADQVRRLLAVAQILDGASRSEAAKGAGVTSQIVRDWVVRFNEGGPDGLATGAPRPVGRRRYSRLCGLRKRITTPCITGNPYAPDWRVRLPGA